MIVLRNHAASRFEPPFGDFSPLSWRRARGRIPWHSYILSSQYGLTHIGECLTAFQQFENGYPRILRHDRIP
jgi:hypothetical protein